MVTFGAVAKSDPRRGAGHPSSLSEKKEAKKEKCFHNGGQRPPPTFAALRQRRDLIIAYNLGWVFPKREGTHRPKAVGKEDSVKETHQGFLSRSVGKPIFALQKS